VVGLSQEQKEILGSAEKLSALLTTAETAIQSFDTEKILNDTLDKSLEIFRFDSAYIRLLDPATGNLIVRISRGLTSQTCNKTTSTIRIAPRLSLVKPKEHQGCKERYIPIFPNLAFFAPLRKSSFPNSVI
jgi:hypothetical protein